MARTGVPMDSDNWEIKFRVDEEMEFFTELALHETERWIQAVTRMKFPYPDDPRKSLEDGILLCELLNCIKNSSVKRINRQAAPIAGLDNVNVFLNACRSEFGLYETQLFNPADLEDLSHRAIADSDQLKEESDRRLRNVAITIYWLGRAVANQNYPVPVLDFSAFTPLINHNAKDIISNDHIYKQDNSWDHSYDHSSAYESNGFSRSVINQSYDSNHNHFRDSSYESYASYGKGSEDSLDEPNYNMPVGRLSQFDGKDKYNGMYRSSPDLAVPSFNHRRSSSTDSLDGSYRGSHSRQSSDSCDGYPTRNISRRTSSSIADPLQFIKSKGAEDMAKQATEQIKQVEETKKMKTPSITEVTKEEDDWQSSLGDWKSRRKSHSAAFQIKEEQEEQDKKKEEAERSNKASPQKSYKQIQEERERRKSGGNLKSFYPVDDDDDDDDDDDGDDAFISPIKSSESETVSSSFNKIKSSTPSNKSKADVAAWAQNSDGSDEFGTESQDKNKPQTLDNKTKDSSDFNQSNNSVHNLSHNSNNNIGNHSDKSRFVSIDHDRGVAESVKQRNSRNNDITSATKLNNIRSKFESPSDKPVTRSVVYDAKVDLKERKKSFEFKASDSDIGRPPKPYPRERGSSNQITSTVETTSPVYSSSKFSGKDYAEKNIKITSKHNSGGFGFTVSGGKDKQQPVIVERVTLGSAADICELKSKDEILLVNKQEVGRLTNQDVNNLIQQAAKQGSIELRVKRFLDSNEDSDEFLSSEEEEESTQKQTQSRETTQSFDSTLSQDEDPPLYNNNNNNNKEGEVKSNGKMEISQISEEYSYTGQPLMQQLKNDASLQRQFDQQNDSSYQSAENISQSYSSYGSSNNASSLDNSDYTTNQPVSYTSTNPEPVKTESAYVRTRISHHDYVNTTSLDDWGYGNHDNQQEEPVVVMRRKKQNVEESVASSSSFDEADRVRSPDVGSSDSDGPPAILRKWQRQRPKSEYKIQDDKTIISQKRLSATLPWQPEHLGIEDRPDDPVLERTRRDFVDTVSNQPVPSPRVNQIDVREDRKRIKAWNAEQEQMRQPDESNAAVVNSNQSFNEQTEFEANRKQMALQYEEDQKRASQVQQENEIKERELLEQEMNRLNIHKRRHRRLLADSPPLQDEPKTPAVESSQPIEITETRATLSYNTPHYSTYQDNSKPINSSSGNSYPIVSSPHPTQITQTRPTISYVAPQHHTYQNVYEPNYVNQPGPPDVSTVNFQVADARPVQMTSDPNQPTMSYMLPSNQSVGLVIDPRNRINEGEPAPQYSIQLNLNQPDTPQSLIIQPEIRSIPANDTNFLEQEKEKIRQEYQKFEETFRKQQDEEDRKFQEREQKLREQEEKLRKEEERLRREEEKLERERQNLRKSAELSKSSQPQFHEPVPTRVRGQSALYKSTVSAPNRTEPKPKPSTYSSSIAMENHSNRHNVHKVEPTWPPKPRQPGNISVNRSHDHWPPSGKTHDVKTISSAKRPNDFPSKDHHGDVQSLKSRFSEPGQRKSWSREDMMAMNRKATPLQSKPENDSSPTSPSSTGPVKREIPTRQEIHSLNAVPKPKLRQSVDWIGGSDQSTDRRTSARRSDMMKNQYSDPLKGHWLIEEAERRRVNSDINVKSSSMPIQPGPYNGPIKPPRDPNNVWSDPNPHLLPNQRIDPNMPKQIRQTLLQKTANVRGSGAVNSQDNVPQITRNPYLTQTMPPTSPPGYGGYDSPRNGANLPPPTSVPATTNQGPVSGKQLCSACHQELGFGAAMIIEKLGLYYHMPCFRCCVCRMPLGNGVEGADVRIRVNKLHCPNCYSNDEGIQHG